MATVYEVSADELIEEIKEELKEKETVKPPEWSKFVKTSPANELPPEQDDWWYIRSAAILRRVYIEGPIGVERLRRRYSKRDRKGSTPPKREKGSGKIIRTSLQQLEQEGLIEKEEGEGRKISAEGKSFLDHVAEKLTDDF